MYLYKLVNKYVVGKYPVFSFGSCNLYLWQPLYLTYCTAPEVLKYEYRQCYCIRACGLIGVELQLFLECHSLSSVLLHFVSVSHSKYRDEIYSQLSNISIWATQNRRTILHGHSVSQTLVWGTFWVCT